MPGNLYLRGTTWCARIQINGRDERRSLRTTSRKVAKDRLKKLLAEAEAERVGETPAPGTTKEWKDAVLRWGEMKLEGRKESTQKRYKVSLNQLAKHLDGLPLSSLDQPTLNEYVAARMGGGVSGATVRRDLNVVSGVWKVAKRAGWVMGSNPALEELDEIEEMRDPVRPVSARAIAEVIAAGTDMYGALVRFWARTGCRQEEGASLEWAQLDLKAKPATCTFIETKTRSPRVIELTPRVVRDLRRLPKAPPRDDQKPVPFVFWQPFGLGGADRYRQPATLFARLVRQLEAERGARFRGFRCHDLRHTFAVRWLEKGGDVYALSHHLGHSTVDTTDRVYGAWLRKERRRARA